MKQAILFALVLLVGDRLSAQVVECDTMTITYISTEIAFKNDIFSAADSMITVPFINNTHANFAYPQAKLVNTTPLPTGMTLYSTGWVVFASAWNVGDTATASISYNVTAPIPDNYTVTFKLYMTNFAPLSIDSCVFANTLTINLKPTVPSAVNEVNAGHSFSFYPNPAKDRIEVSVNAETTLEIYGISGTLLQTATIGKQANSVDVSSLPTGVYFLREKGGGVVQKLVKVD
jgi:hypothetical protein